MRAAVGFAALAGCETAMAPKEQRHELGCVAGMMTGTVIGGVLGGPLGAVAGEQMGAGVGAAAGGPEGTPMTCNPAKQGDEVPWS